MTEASKAERRIRDSFARQPAMALLGARLARVEPGEVEITLPFREALTQQNGFLHAGVVTAVVDSACGYAALSTMSPDKDVLSVEFKVNLLAPAKGESFRALGKVRRAGRTLTICTGEVFAKQGTGEKLVALMQATMIAVEHQA